MIVLMFIRLDGMNEISYSLRNNHKLQRLSAKFRYNQCGRLVDSIGLREANGGPLHHGIDCAVCRR